MKHVRLSELLASADGDETRQMELFAVWTLGLTELLSNGGVSALDAAQCFFNATNCKYVRDVLKNKIADKIMSHGVQLHDLFDALDADEAQREFQRELSEIHELCMRLLDSRELAA